MGYKEFKVMVIKILTRLWRIVKEPSENFDKVIENTKKKNKLELKNTTTEMKNILRM